MNWMDVLGVASGGGLFGLVGAVAKGWLELKQAKVRIEERKAEAEIQRELIKLQTDKATIEGEAKAFAGSQAAAAGEGEGIAALSAIATTPAQRWLVLISGALRFGTRSLLTWFAHLIAFIVFFTLDAEMKRLVLLQVFAMASTYGGWWFGSRQVFRFNK